MAGARDFSVPKHVQIRFGPHPSKRPFGFWVSFPGIKRSGLEACLSSPCSIDVENVLSCTTASAMCRISWHGPGRFHSFKSAVVEWLQLNTL